MDMFVFMSFGIAAGSLCGIAFLVCKIIKEEQEKKEKAAFVKAFSKRHNKGCPDCGCLPCQCGS
jgi:hypothetical protein